jgi:hypothetical protein
MDSDEREELIAALTQVAGFAEGLLTLTRQLLEAVDGERERPSEADLAEMRAGLDRWGEALDAVRQRIAAATATPRDHMQ